ncbi:hypothetical protein EV702DRAFT_1198451 [Suillus placidus]|uniref:Uncharacterized protein n=1 Tax=Suillus placidus TaxID=48579 RepID=A0A9P7D2K9_9AGAM|nr:hypothetical protein EV702DRAFT_1198451 [Suillus placidus]
MSVHFEHNGEPLAILLDIIEVSKSHSGAHLAEAFVKILEDFGISDKKSRAALGGCGGSEAKVNSFLFIAA